MCSCVQSDCETVYFLFVSIHRAFPPPGGDAANFRSADPVSSLREACPPPRHPYTAASLAGTQRCFRTISIQLLNYLKFIEYVSMWS